MLNIYEKEEYVPLFKKYFSDEQISIESEQPLGGPANQKGMKKKSIPAWEAVYLAKLYEDAQDNDPGAMRTLAWHYYQGKSIAKNYLKAFELYQQAAELNNTVTEEQRLQEIDAVFGMANDGFAPAQRHLGDAYLSGKGIEQDSKKAYEWFLKAAQQGDEKAQFCVAEMLHNGEAGTKDLSEAVQWFLKSAEQGMAESQYALGICYANGDGVEKNYAEAERWLLKAALQGDPRHEYQLAILYLTHGEREKAFGWLEQSANKGYQPAKKRLSEIQSAHGIQINVNP